ncbi:MAG: TIGR03560 family F420-dependent LLM class oxidoreductase [Chloroflexi bacterium]|nr:TIGR03560 family F420-dependent LLM class oxidoreductase [Chloroflexota bacterium]
MDVAIMIEGQMGLTWPRWKQIARAVEDLGFAGLYRSDHFTNDRPPDQDSLEMWVSLTWLASNTTRIDFGPLVTPVSFRHPAMTARMASAVDDLSGGRLVLGVGAGWQEREHHNYSFPLLKGAGRFDRFEEALLYFEAVFQSETPYTHAGKFYQFHDAVLLPRPSRPGGPPLLIGGNGMERTLGLVARFAREWNGVYLSPEQFKLRSTKLDALLAARGRQPVEVRRSLMTGLVFGKDDTQLKLKLDGDDPDKLREVGMIVGTPQQIQDQLGALAEAGVQRVMVQWFNLDDVDGLAALAKAVL